MSSVGAHSDRRPRLSTAEGTTDKNDTALTSQLALSGVPPIVSLRQRQADPGPCRSFGGWGLKTQIRVSEGAEPLELTIVLFLALPPE